METYLIVLLRIATIMALLLGATLFVMGKRPIGELPVFDFLVLVVMGSIVGADIADPDIEHLPTAFAVVVLAAIQRLFSYFSLRFRKFRKLITFEPTVVLYDGKLIHNNIKRIHYSLDEIIMMLRENDIFDVSKVEYGIVEANGKLSIITKPGHEHATIGDLNLPAPQSNAAVTIIMDGKINGNNVRRLNLSEQDVVDMIQRQGVSKISEVFHAELDSGKNVNISKYNETAQDFYANTDIKSKTKE